MNVLIIFDFDGVIADSETPANAVLAEMVTELGAPTTLEDAYDRYLGKRFADVVAQIERDVGQTLPADFAAALQKRTLQRFRDDLQPVSGVLDFIDAFKEVPKCIASTSSPDRIHMCLDLLCLREAFEPNVYSVSMVTRGKPHPDVFLYAAAQLGAPPSRTIVIEDSASGVTAGVAAGMTVIGLLAASHIKPDSGDRLRRAGAHHVVDTFDEAREIVSEMLAVNAKA